MIEHKYEQLMKRHDEDIEDLQKELHEVRHILSSVIDQHATMVSAQSRLAEALRSHVENAQRQAKLESKPSH